MMSSVELRQKFLTIRNDVHLEIEIGMCERASPFPLRSNMCGRYALGIVCKLIKSMVHVDC